MLKYADTAIVLREVPDEITLAINITGCPCRCTGCHSPHLSSDTGEALDCRTLASLIESSPGISCVGFMGGDAAPSEVARLASFVRVSYGLKTCWYSGRDMDAGHMAAPVPYLDYLKVGPYREECGPLDSPLTNQRFYRVSYDGAGRKYLFEDITRRFRR